MWVPWAVLTVSWLLLLVPLVEHGVVALAEMCVSVYVCAYACMVSWLLLLVPLVEHDVVALAAYLYVCMYVRTYVSMRGPDVVVACAVFLYVCI